VGFLENTDTDKSHTDKVYTDKQDTDKMSIQEITSAKGLFSNLLPSFPISITVSAPVADNSACSFDDDDDENEGQLVIKKVCVYARICVYMYVYIYIYI
jgi:hypothetical protein